MLTGAFFMDAERMVTDDDGRVEIRAVVFRENTRVESVLSRQNVATCNPTHTMAQNSINRSYTVV